MKLIEKIRRSCNLLQSSIVVIVDNPKLLLFPALIGLFTVGMALFFLAPIILIPTGFHFLNGQHWSALAHKLFSNGTLEVGSNAARTVLQTSVMAYGTLIYIVSMIAATFCNVAFYSQIMSALNNRPVSFRDGIAIACSRFQSIVVWSLLAGLVGIIIRQIENRLPFIGRVIAGLIGLAWSVAAVFVIPVIIRERPTGNPFSVLSKSATTIRQTWGEALAGYVGLQGTNALVFLTLLGMLIAGGVLSFITSNWLIMIPVGALFLLLLLAYSYLANVASQVYLCALYIYASEGVVPEPYDRQLLDGAWKIKTK